MPMELYSLHATPEPGEFIIQKFDTDYHCESMYALSTSTCLCPQGHKPKCRHRTMLGMFLAHDHIGDGWFLEWNTRMWRKPVNDITNAPISLADETVMGTSAATAGDSAEPSSPAPGAVAPPPSPPEGPILARAAEAAPASPVVAGAPIVKRRKIP